MNNTPHNSLKIAKYSDLKNIPVNETDEQFMSANSYDKNITLKYKKDDMKPFLGEVILVRDTVARMLAAANKKIQSKHHNLTLLISYGYRSLEIQQKYFDRQVNIIKKEQPKIAESELLEAVHKRVAVPEVAGHPTGGAIDVTLYDIKLNQEIDMGTDIADYSQNTFSTYSTKISDQQQASRLLLHDTLINEGFCPFYEEWWHFSYGDKEWAWFYNQPTALYEQKSIKNVSPVAEADMLSERKI